MFLPGYKCNRCGNKFSSEDCNNNPFYIGHRFGFGSDHDGEEFIAHFCPACEDIIADLIGDKCSIPPFAESN